MVLRRKGRRRGSVLVEYGLLIAGVALACVLAIGVLGRKTADMMGVVAATIPGAHAEDNKPIMAADLIPLDTHTTSGLIQLDAGKLVQEDGGIDRMENLLGQGGGALLIVDQ
jgi:pilus assembly protein Flp/PilA